MTEFCLVSLTKRVKQRQMAVGIAMIAVCVPMNDRHAWRETLNIFRIIFPRFREYICMAHVET